MSKKVNSSIQNLLDADVDSIVTNTPKEEKTKKNRVPAAALLAAVAVVGIVLFFILRGTPEKGPTGPTAFEYLKSLCRSGPYVVSVDGEYSVGISYMSGDDSIYIMDAYDDGNGTTISGTIAVPASLSGQYNGLLAEAFFGWPPEQRLYSIDASKLTSRPLDMTYYSIGSRDTTADELYAMRVCHALSAVYEKLLEPNGYTYADLGFNSYSA